MMVKFISECEEGNSGNCIQRNGEGSWRAMEQTDRFVSLPIFLNICFLFLWKCILIVRLTAEEKAPYEAKAQVDKRRYQNEISDYKNPQQPTSMDLMDESDSN